MALSVLVAIYFFCQSSLMTGALAWQQQQQQQSAVLAPRRRGVLSPSLATAASANHQYQHQYHQQRAYSCVLQAKSSSSSSSSRSRQVELGIFGSKSSSSSGADNRENPEGDEKTKKAGPVRSLFRRIRDGKNNQENDDGTELSPPSWTSRVTSWIPFTEDAKNNGQDNTNTTSDEKKKRSSSLPSVVVKFVQKVTSGNSNSADDDLWVTVFPKTRISPGEMVPVTVAGIDLLVVASQTGGKKGLYCIANSCPHLGTPLELGQLVRLPRADEISVSTASTTRNAVPLFDNVKDAEFDNVKDAESIAKQTADAVSAAKMAWTELQVSSILQQDGCEDCIVCPLHKTAFALESGQPRGEWCPYPPVVGKIVGAIKPRTAAATFGVRVFGKDVQVRMNNPISIE
eukprot:CAMPEP_0198155972 /NCGR_PEP_ID=MMETSP1443-20131203/69414_1 /TAXON_ID=186043 /ORGANISM="Entomoneis sp., Strain CCMP2396" /LENGTH=400 /DNA_ID=CAMNT_0043822743 /DNA_START=253 /DNA_END=1455 /DNA_ORIENTATION=-